MKNGFRVGGGCLDWLCNSGRVPGRSAEESMGGIRFTGESVSSNWGGLSPEMDVTDEPRALPQHNNTGEDSSAALEAVVHCLHRRPSVVTSVPKI